MTLHDSIWQIFTDLKIGKEYALTSTDIKERVRDLTGHYPNQNEFKSAMDAIRMPENPFCIVTSNFGYFRSKPDWHSTKKYKRSLMNRIDRNNQLIKSIK